MQRHQLQTFVVFLVFGLLACGEENADSGVSDLNDIGVTEDGRVGTVERPTARFAPSEVLTETPLGAVPYPNDLYLSPTGHIQLDTFAYNIAGSFVNRLLMTLREHVQGFACAGTHYVSFDDSIDLDLLPADGAASVDENSALVLMDIDPNSPDYGTRFPIRWRFQSEETFYLPSNTLAVRTVEGLALRARTTYALWVTSDVALRPNSFATVMGEAEPEQMSEGWEIYAPLRALDVDLDRIAVASVFTTMDPVSGMFSLRDFIDSYDVPEVQGLERSSSFPNLYVEYVGTYTAPNFQNGEPPFLREGGFVEYDMNGDPIVQRMETLRFSMSIPSEFEEPPNGWPIVMYGHGTGGNYRSYIDSGAAASLARVGIATVGIDQVHHGTRDIRPDNCEQQSDPSACVSALFFNFLNPLAGRDNVRQSAADFVSLARLLRNRTLLVASNQPETEASETEPVTSDAGLAEADAALSETDGGLFEADAGLAEADGGSFEADAGLSEADGGLSEADAGLAEADGGSFEADADLAEADAGLAEADAGLAEAAEPLSFRFDPQSLMYLGHSQGGVNGPLFLAVDDNVTGGMLSAAGGNIAITLEQKSRPFDIAGFAEMFVMIGDNEALDRWHPLFMLVQTFIEPGDPINYARFWFAEPRDGSKPKSVFMTAGLDDEYTPPDAIFSLAAAGQVPIIPPIRVPIELNEILGINPSGIPPFPANVADGQAAAGLLQIPNVGHFVFQRDITIRNRYKQFFKSIVDGNPQIF